MDENLKTRGQLIEDIKALKRQIKEILRGRSGYKETEGVLPKAEDKYRTLLDHIPAIIYVAALDGSVGTLYISPQAEALTGFSPSDYGANPRLWHRQIHPDDRERILKGIAHVGTTGQPFVSEYRMLSRNGHVVWFHDEVVMGKDKTGKPLFLQGIMFDITERKKAEGKILATQLQMQNIIEKNPDAMVVLNKDGIISFANTAAEQLFCLKKERLIGNPLGFPLITNKTTQIDIISKTGKGGIGEMRVVEAEWNNEPSYLASIRDITELKRAEETRIEIAQRKRFDQLKNEFLSTVSHELRTPLTTMKEFASIISDEIPGKLTKDQKEYTGIIKNNIDRLARLINNLLDISKIEAGKIELKKRPIDIADLANSVISTFKLQADEKDIKLKFPSCASLPKIYADADRIVQVFTNLIGNAIKFTPKNGRITVEIKDKKKVIECSVADTGAGIAPENIGKLFGKFQQFGRVAGAGARGTGLGLSISKALIEMHNGEIWVESKVGKGSKFIFTLPKK